MNDIRSPRVLRLAEFLLVLSVAFSGPVLFSLFTVFRGSLKYGPQFLTLGVVNTIVSEIIAIGVLGYVLFRRGLSVRHLGFEFAWKDIPRSVLILGLSWLGLGVVYFASDPGSYLGTGRLPKLPEDKHALLQAGVTIWTVTLVLINPFCEELIVRAYTMSEIEYLTGSGALAIAGSVALQVTYHLYQGVLTALALGVPFLVFSLFYRRTGRITPVILAHLYWDVIVLMANVR